MKNIHIVPTDKPTGIFKSGNNLLFSIMNKVRTNHEGFHIYITSDEDIKENTRTRIQGLNGDWFYNTIYNFIARTGDITPYDFKIILTTDRNLIADGVQAIDDEFLEWFVKNPTCEKVEVNDWLDDNGNIAFGGDKQYQICNHLYDKIIIPKEEPKQETVFENAKLTLRKHILENKEQVIKDLDEMREQSSKQETLEEAAEIDLTNLCYYDKRNPDCLVDDEDIEGHKKSLLKKNKTCNCDNCFYDRSKLTEQLIWQAERMYSEEEVVKIVEKSRETGLTAEFLFLTEQFKKK